MICIFTVAYLGHGEKTIQLIRPGEILIEHKAGFGAVGLGSAQSRFWSRHKAGFGAVGVGRHKAGFGAGTKPVLERLV